jgi:predicted DNA-binding transcriptional regulator YafY
VWETCARLLKVCRCCRPARDWSGADLAAGLEVSERTARRDVERLLLRR